MWSGRSNEQLIRGVLQSKDGLITEVLEATDEYIKFEAAFEINQKLSQSVIKSPENIVFSERSRIARLGVQIKSETLDRGQLKNNQIILKMTARSVILGYPSLDLLRRFFCRGFPVGRLVFCDPDALLTAEEVLNAIRNSELKLPASITISSNGEIIISPHKVIYELTAALDENTLSQILMREDGREILNHYQTGRVVHELLILPGKGIVTTCSMYLNEHYVVLQSGVELGKQQPAAVLDPVKTRGIRIFLEIVNESNQPIVNPLISAKIYRAERTMAAKGKTKLNNEETSLFTAEELLPLKRTFNDLKTSECLFLSRPVAIIGKGDRALDHALVLESGSEQKCEKSRVECLIARHYSTSKSVCPRSYATNKIRNSLDKRGSSLFLKYFPNLFEHSDIVNLAKEGLIDSIYFFEPSYEHGPFLSQDDHSRLHEYHAFDVDVHWASGINGSFMTHTMRDGKGYFVTPEKLIKFHNSMLFAFYGSNKGLSETGLNRLGQLMDSLIDFWGNTIGILTGGGSGVMEVVNTLAKERGILSGANFLELTDQTMIADVDFCQVFQSTCRHSRQKWFEVASFPIFNVGGLGSLEELGITLCNMKVSISDPVPVILFDTEGEGKYWSNVKNQINEMILKQRAPHWIREILIMTNNPEEVIDVYRNYLQLF